MERNPPRFGAISWVRARRAALVAFAIVLVPGAALAATITVKGKINGGNKLLNPVWAEAAEAKRNRYSFRDQSPTVRGDVRVLTSHLPKELCIAALAEKGTPNKSPLRMVIAGGRTSPVTLVVAEGQQILFENQDPFPHKIYDTNNKGLAPVETGPAKNRGWTPPGPGKYEIRDQLAPSVRSWVVVEPRVVNVGYPDRKGDFAIDLEPGKYKLRGYHNGEPVGQELDVVVAPAPVEQLLKAPLVVTPEGGAPPKPGK